MIKLDSPIILFSLLLMLNCTDAKKKQLTSSIPFEFVRNQILVEVFVENSGPYKMIFDTGVTPSSINIEEARKLKVPIDSSNSAFASGRGNAKFKLFPATMTNFKIGSIAVDSLKAVALDNTFISEVLGESVIGILGHSFLQGRVFKIDYESKQIQFYNSPEELSKTFEGKNIIEEEFIYQQGDIIPILKNFKINGKDFIASLDTGSSLSIEIFKHHINNYAIQIDSTKTYEVTGAQGKDKNIEATINEFSLDDVTFYNVECGIASIKNTMQLRQGNIGNGFLKQFKVSFDYINKRVVFEF